MSSPPKLTPLVVAAQERVPCEEHGYLADIEAPDEGAECKSRAANNNEADLTVIPLCETPVALCVMQEEQQQQLQQQQLQQLQHQQQQQQRVLSIKPRTRELSAESEETLFTDGSLLDVGYRSDKPTFPHCTSCCNSSKTADYSQLRRHLNLLTTLAFLASAGVIIGVSCYFTPGSFRWAVVLLAAQLPLLYVLQYSLAILLLPLVNPEILQQNSHFYSASAPEYGCSTRPSVTLLLSVNENPLSKEGMTALQNAQVAAAGYQANGGMANVMLVDADLLALDEPEKAARMALYESMQMAYLGLPARFAQRALRKDGSSTDCSVAEDDVEQSSLQLRRSRNYVLNLVRRMETRTEQAKSLGATLPAADAMHQVWCSKYYNREFLAQGEVAIGDVLITVDMNSNLTAENITSMVHEFAHSDDISYVRSVSSTSSSPTVASRARGCGAGLASQLIKTAEMLKVVMGAIGGVILPADEDFAVKWATLREVGDAFELAESMDHVEFWDEESVTGSLDLACTLSKRGVLGRYVAYNDLSPRYASSSLGVAMKVFVRELPSKAIRLVQHCWRVGRWEQWHHLIVLTMSPWAVLLALLSGFVSLFLAFDMPALWTICIASAVLLAVAVLMAITAVLLSHAVSAHCQRHASRAKCPATDIEQH